MKKLLALVLALVMTLSLCVTSNAAYKDAADVDYKEAVDVMSAIGVLEGSDGKFNPDGILTREQAAKIVTYMLLGKTAADKLAATAAPYSDVAVDRWSAGAIGYCATEGILAGVGGGKFDPTGNLTGLAFAKMCLVALGYDPELEGFTGTDWAINVAKLAVTTGVVDDLDIVLSNNLSRQEAAQMALNTEKAVMVNYTGGTSIQTSDGTSIKINSNRYEETNGNTGGQGYKVASNDGKLNFCEKYATKLALDNTDNDGFGRPAGTWVFKGVDVGTYAEKADKTYTAAASGSTTAAKIKSLGLTDYVLNGGSVTPVVNGKPGTPVTTLAGVVGLTGNGTLVEVYFDSNAIETITDIVVTKTELAQVSSKSATRVNLTSKTAAVVGALTVNDNEDIFADASEYAANDYVLVVPVWNTTDNKYDVYSVATPDTVVGKITATTRNSGDSANSAISVAGESYTASAVATTDVTGAVISTSKESTVWLDSYGYAVYAKTAAAAVNSFVYVLKAYNTLKDGVITPMAKVVKTNGEIADIETAAGGGLATAGLNQITGVTNDVYTLSNAITAVTDGNGNNVAEATGDTNIITAAGGSKAGVIALTDNQEIKASDKALNTTNSGFTNYYASDVKFVYVDKANSSASVKDGVQKVAAIDYNHSGSGNCAWAIVEQLSSTNTTLVVKTVIMENATATSAEAKDILYMNSTNKDSTVTLKNEITGKDVSVNVYTFYKDGEKITLPVSSGATPAQGFFTYAESESIPGSYVIATYGAISGVTAQKVAQTVTGTFDKRMITAGTTIDATKATQIIDLRTAAVQAANPIVLTAAGLCEAKTTYNGLTLSYLYNDDTGDAKIIYVTAQGTGYTVTPATITTVAGYTIATSAATANVGDTVTVTVSVAANSAAKTITFACAGHTITSATNVACATDTVNAQTFTFTFVMSATTAAPTVTLS